MGHRQQSLRWNSCLSNPFFHLILHIWTFLLFTMSHEKKREAHNLEYITWNEKYFYFLVQQCCLKVHIKLKNTGRKKWQGETRSSHPCPANIAPQEEDDEENRQRVQKSLGKSNSYSMLFNIWKTWWLSAQILPHGCWAWERNRVAVRLTVRSLSVANTLFIRLSVCLFIWLSNYPSRQTARREPNVNNTVDDGHMSQLVGLLFGQLSCHTGLVQRRHA